MDFKTEKKIDDKVQDVTINIFGKISTYLFATIHSEFLSEFKNVISEASQKKMTWEAFLNSLLSLTLNNGINNLPDFKDNLNMEKFELLCPKLFEIVSAIENGKLGDHYWLYEKIFTSREEVAFFDENIEISIYIDDNEIGTKQTLHDFCGDSVSVYLEDLDQNSVDFKMLQQFHDKNMEEFGLPEALEELSFEKHSNGVTIISPYFEPPNLAALSSDENHVKIEHNNRATFTYNIKTVDFSLSKLFFLAFIYAKEFTNSSNNQIGSYLFYNNEIIRPDVNIDVTDEINLRYNNKSTVRSLGFLLNG